MTNAPINGRWLLLSRYVATTCLAIALVLYLTNSYFPYPIGEIAADLPVYLAPIGFLALATWMIGSSLKSSVKILMGIGIIALAIVAQFFVVLGSLFYFGGDAEIRRIPAYPSATSWHAYRASSFPSGDSSVIDFSHPTATAEEIKAYYQIELANLGWVTSPQSNSQLAYFRKGKLNLQILESVIGDFMIIIGHDVYLD